MRSACFGAAAGRAAQPLGVMRSSTVLGDPRPGQCRRNMRAPPAPRGCRCCAQRFPMPTSASRIAAPARGDALEQIARDHLSHLSPGSSCPAPHCAASAGTGAACARCLAMRSACLGLGIWARVLPAVVPRRRHPDTGWRGARLRRREWLHADDGSSTAMTTRHPPPAGHAAWDGVPLLVPAGMGRLQFEPALREPVVSCAPASRQGTCNSRPPAHAETAAGKRAAARQRARLPLLFDSADQLLS